MYMYTVTHIYKYIYIQVKCIYGYVNIDTSIDIDSYFLIQDIFPEVIGNQIRGLARCLCPGEENGNPLQYSCLENSMGRGTWQAIIHGGCKKPDTTEHTHTCTQLG